MSKRSIISFSSFFIIIALCFMLFLPETLRQMEASDYFLMTGEFFKEKLVLWHSLSLWLCNFLLQFFIIPPLGGIIYALILTLIAVLAGIMPLCRGRKAIEERGIIIPLIIMVVIPFNLDVALQGMFCFGMIDLCLWLKNKWAKVVIMIVMGLFGWLLTGWVLLTIALLTIAIATYLAKKDFIIPVVALVAIALTFPAYWCWSDNIGFIPFLERFLLCPTSLINVWVYITIYVGGIILLFLPASKLKKGWKAWLPLMGTVVLTCYALKIHVWKPRIIYTEECYTYGRLADQKQWKKLLEISRPESKKKKIALCYALLAESALGTLPDNVFHYNIQNPDDFLYRFETTKFSTYFNRLFYDNLGVYDEASRQAFEYGVMTPDGHCLSSLRQMTHYAALLNEYKLAEKYLTILDKTLMNKSFVKKEREFIEKRKAKPMTAYDKNKPHVVDCFVKVYPFNSEMVRLLDNNITNKKALDYLLIGLLMQRDLEKFSVIMNGYSHIYRNKELPSVYAQAGGMLVSTPQLSLHTNFNYSESYDRDFSAFYQLQHNARSMQEFASYIGTYWYYYFLLQPQGGQNAQQQNTQKVVN